MCDMLVVLVANIYSDSPKIGAFTPNLLVGNNTRMMDSVTCLHCDMESHHIYNLLFCY
jgi:hypothetical protein